jgi:prophage regulatory protein
MDDERLLKVEEVAKKFAVSVRKVWRFIGEAGFPKPIKLGPKTTRWSEQEINEFIKKRKDER